MITDLVLVRHGESTANVERERAEAGGSDVIEIGGRDADVPLSGLGRRQAVETGRALSRVFSAGSTTVWSSPYERARRTAEVALAAAGSAAPVRLDERLRDRELGIVDALTRAGVAHRHPQEAERRRLLGKFYYRPPGGESWADVALRLRSLLRDVDHGESPASVVMFTHDAVVTLIRYVCLAMTESEVLDLAAGDPIANASISRLRSASHGPDWTVTVYNDQQHLIVDGDDLRTLHPGEPHVHPA